MADAGMILDALFEQMPKELAEGYDNVGLLAGSRKNTVTTVLCALDLNSRVVDEAIAAGAELIVTHHPILFRGRKNLCEDDPEGAMLVKLVRAGIALIAMHTNFDASENGVNDALAAKLGLANVAAHESGMRMGDIEETKLASLAGDVQDKLGGVVRRYGNAGDIVRRVAVMGGSGGDYANIALENGCDCFITGEIGYHYALDMYDRGMCVLEAGHAATELPAVGLLAEKLKGLGMGLDVHISAVDSFR